ncbi:hypothetical protein AWB72_02877 [Caballeronia concitans]|uniref:Uncharacterized protein n=1 Tax=Caballeronia concitans TaxID=1777133 RepID=A0A658QYB9_9BURK|nr:hypothetical protein BurMR1_1573 [Burkholderia sp. MR1]SAL32325.1 hypothetical protein AWB72_02877 [Caballeronia concitans]
MYVRGCWHVSIGVSTRGVEAMWREKSTVSCVLARDASAPSGPCWKKTVRYLRLAVTVSCVPSSSVTVFFEPVEVGMEKRTIWLT